MKLFLTAVFLLQILSFSQSTSVRLKSSEGTKRIPALDKEGMIYISVRALAEALNVSYTSKDLEEKIFLKGVKEDLKITAKNPFYIITSKKGKLSRVVQVPTTTYYFSGDIYIPAASSEKILNEVLDKDLIFDEDAMLITSGEKTPAIEHGGSYDITSITIDEKANGTLVKITSGRTIQYYNTSFSDGMLKVILRGVKTDPGITDRITFAGLIKKLEIHPAGEDTELHFLVGDEYSASEIIKEDEGNNLVLTIHNKLFTGKDQNKYKDKWDFDVIVIDAGHGGKDAGAVGITGVMEKTINLSIALMLGKLIEDNLKDVRVEYTRKDDRFVELYKRGRMANEKNGKLFISIHCNSTADRSSGASGFEAYLLRPGRTQEAIAIAERENSVINFEDDPKRYQQLTDENFILVSMAHSAYMKYSEKFSEYLNGHFSSGFGLSSRGVKQAGFYVLVGASMPSVLIEAGFLSNRTDAAYLNSKKGQQKTADLIFQSIKSFKGYYEGVLGSR